MSNALEELKRIGNEVAQLTETVEAEQAGTEPTAPTNYSSTVTSCTVDPATGNISLSVTLYPGDSPINPVPTPDEQAAAAEVQSRAIAPEDAPPADQVPAQ